MQWNSEFEFDFFDLLNVTDVRFSLCTIRGHCFEMEKSRLKDLGGCRRCQGYGEGDTLPSRDLIRASRKRARSSGGAVGVCSIIHVDGRNCGGC